MTVNFHFSVDLCQLIGKRDSKYRDYRKAKDTSKTIQMTLEKLGKRLTFLIGNRKAFELEHGFTIFSLLIFFVFLFCYFSLLPFVSSFFLFFFCSFFLIFFLLFFLVLFLVLFWFFFWSFFCSFFVIFLFILYSYFLIFFSFSFRHFIFLINRV